VTASGERHAKHSHLRALRGRPPSTPRLRLLVMNHGKAFIDPEEDS
jgi:hypothetical protein